MQPPKSSYSGTRKIRFSGVLSALYFRCVGIASNAVNSRRSWSNDATGAILHRLTVGGPLAPRSQELAARSPAALMHLTAPEIDMSLKERCVVALTACKGSSWWAAGAGSGRRRRRLSGRGGQAPSSCHSGISRTLPQNHGARDRSPPGFAAVRAGLRGLNRAV